MSYQRDNNEESNGTDAKSRRSIIKLSGITMATAGFSGCISGTPLADTTPENEETGPNDFHSDKRASYDVTSNTFKARARGRYSVTVPAERAKQEGIFDGENVKKGPSGNAVISGHAYVVGKGDSNGNFKAIDHGCNSC